MSLRDEIVLVPSAQYFDGPSVSAHDSQYQTAMFKGSALSVRSPNNYVLLSGCRVCRIVSFLSRGIYVIIVGYVY